MTAARCPVCDRAVATAEDYDTIPEGHGAHLCWRAWDNRQCDAARVDWRTRALAAEAEVERLRALMAGRTTPPTREEFDALADIGATLRVRWPGGDDEIPTHGDYYWTAIATVPDGSRWWAHGADGALIEWPKVKP